LYGGRWNEPGVAAVYCSSSLALAALETLAHMEQRDLPAGLVSIRADIPTGIGVDQLELSKLPRNWRRYPAPVAVRRLGMDWLKAGLTAVLRVPSALISEEYNYLVNPSHPDASKIVVYPAVPFRFDIRISRNK
jgi:RES domain-containing protein